MDEEAIMAPSQIDEHYEEKRQHPRLELDVPAVVLCNSAQLVETKIYDISPDGLQIRCSREAALAINPGAKQINPTDNLMVNVIFNMPSNKEQIKVICNVYYFTLTHDGSDKDVAFGLKFRKFDGKSGKYVEQFFMNELEPGMCS